MVSLQVLSPKRSQQLLSVFLVNPTLNGSCLCAQSRSGEESPKCQETSPKFHGVVGNYSDKD